MCVLLQSEKSWCVWMLRLDSGPQSRLDSFFSSVTDSRNLQLELNSPDQLLEQWRVTELLLVCEAGSSSQPDQNQGITVPATLSQIQYKHISIYLYISSRFLLHHVAPSVTSNLKTQQRRNQIIRTTSIYMLKEFLHKFASLNKQIQHEISTEVVTVTHLFKQNKR